MKKKQTKRSRQADPVALVKAKLKGAPLVSEAEIRTLAGIAADSEDVSAMCEDRDPLQGAAMNRRAEAIVRWAEQARTSMVLLALVLAGDLHVTVVDGEVLFWPTLKGARRLERGSR